jgi:ABC-2 type transport system permease protein
VSLWPVITSEWIKFRSLRSTRFALLVTVVLSVGISALLCFAERQQWPMQDAPTHLSFDPTATSLSGFFLAEIAIGVIGVLIMSSEYSSGSIRSTLAATPGRAIVLFAKAVVLFCSILVVAEICSFASFVIGQAILNGVTPTASLSDPTVLRAVVLSGLSLALLALLALGIATMLRHTAGSITVYVCLTLVLFLIVLALPSSWGVHVFKFLPEILTASMRSTTSSRSTTAQYGALYSPVVSSLILASYAVASLVAGGILLTRRDA